MNKKTFIKIASALLFNAIVGGVIATLLGCSPMGGAAVAYCYRNSLLYARGCCM